MKNVLLNKLLEGKQSVREIIDECALVKEDQEGFNSQIKNRRRPVSKASISLGTPQPDEEETNKETETNSQPEVPDGGEYRHLFVRRWHEGEEKPYKRVKMENAMEALNLYFSWLMQYKKDKVEIWSDSAADVKNFYRFCVKNREMLEEMWKNSMRSKKSGLWTSAYRDLQQRSRQSAANLTGTLYPFCQDGK